MGLPHLAHSSKILALNCFCQQIKRLNSHKGSIFEEFFSILPANCKLDAISGQTLARPAIDMIEFMLQEIYAELIKFRDTSRKKLTFALESDLRFLIGAELNDRFRAQSISLAVDYCRLIAFHTCDENEKMELVVSATLIVEGSKEGHVETIAYVAFLGGVGISVLASYRLGPCSANGDLLNFAEAHSCDPEDISDDSILWAVKKELFI